MKREGIVSHWWHTLKYGNICCYRSFTDTVLLSRVDIHQMVHTVKPVNKHQPSKSKRLAFLYMLPLFRGWFILIKRYRFLEHLPFSQGDLYLKMTFRKSFDCRVEFYLIETILCFFIVTFCAGTRIYHFYLPFYVV